MHENTFGGVRVVWGNASLRLSAHSEYSTPRNVFLTSLFTSVHTAYTKIIRRLLHYFDPICSYVTCQAAGAWAFTT